jgi:hypothetical protein
MERASRRCVLSRGEKVTVEGPEGRGWSVDRDPQEGAGYRGIQYLSDHPPAGRPGTRVVADHAPPHWITGAGGGGEAEKEGQKQ